MTLGELIERLKQLPAESMVNLCNSHSYRGYYHDLAFEWHYGIRQAYDILMECEDAIGKVFEGYKGGEFMMDEDTPVWIAPYGSCGVKLMDLLKDGTIETEEDIY